MEFDAAENSLLDAVVFGASGFTGKYVVKEMVRVLAERQKLGGAAGKFGVAGRSRSRLEASVEGAQEAGPSVDCDIIVADVGDPTSLLAMCRRTRVLLNCVGPFRYYGAPVVRACVEAGCDYLDICGEPEFMERTEADHHRAGAEAGSLIVSACGFDSVPADLGVLFAVCTRGCWRAHCFIGSISHSRKLRNWVGVDVTSGP